MLFKLSVSNIRRSLRDYAIYFFTLIIGVSVFYVFNAISGQAAMMRVAESRYDIIELLRTMLSGVSVFVAGVLGLLIVYASRFLMKRRNKEFALYMTLGMSKGNISAILLIETVIIGIGSLIVGLLLGIGLSQLMSAVVANLFEADMTAYKFTVSGEAALKTVIYFAIMYLVVMLFNSVVITKMKLIDLMQSGRRSEQIKMKNPVVCIIVFLVAAAALGYAYYQVAYNARSLTRNMLIGCIIAGIISTFLIFWSMSGMFLRIVMSMKHVYHNSLNSFTFRQISSKVNTMVFSMTVICLMLFVTICSLAASFSVRNSMNENIKTLCPADVEAIYAEYTDEDKADTKDCDVAAKLSEFGYDVNGELGEYVHVKEYADHELKLSTFFGDKLEAVKAENPFLMYDADELIVTVSDYNKLMRVYGLDELSLDEGEFILLCDYKAMKNVRDEILTKDTEFTVFGNTLRSKYDDCVEGFIDISSTHINTGLFVVPDSAVSGGSVDCDIIIGKYAAADDNEKKAAEERFQNASEALRNALESDEENEYYFGETTKAEIREASIGLGAIITFLGLYIGLVFLIACGAILALKELSDSVDSIGRYEMLRKIGADEKDLGKSLFRQTGIFFLIPLLLAVVHSVFGMKFAVPVLDVFGTENIGSSVTATSVILMLIYGGYFVVTYFCSRNIVRERK